MPHRVIVWCRCHRSQLAADQRQPGSRRETGLSGDPARPGRITRNASDQDGRDRLLTIVFTIRGPWLRVISARPMSRPERKRYDQATRS
jgi:hypothetical protein